MLDDLAKHKFSSSSGIRTTDTQHGQAVVAGLTSLCAPREGVSCCPAALDGDTTWTTTYSSIRVSSAQAQCDTQPPRTVRLSDNALPFEVSACAANTLASRFLTHADVLMSGAVCTPQNAGQVTVLDLRAKGLSGLLSGAVFDSSLRHLEVLLLNLNVGLVGPLPGVLPPKLKYIDMTQTSAPLPLLPLYPSRVWRTPGVVRQSLAGAAHTHTHSVGAPDQL